MAHFRIRFFRLFFVWGCVLVQLVALSNNAVGQDFSNWKWNVNIDTEFSYDSDVFGLSNNQIDRLEDERAEDEISGRFDDMDSVDDFILTPRLRFTAKRPGFRNLDFQIRPSVLYHFYAQNQKKSHLELGLDLQHEVEAHGMLRLDLNYALNVFKKNHLADATDLTGEVTDDERVYEPAIYDDGLVELSYRHRLWKRPKRQESVLGIRRIDGEVEVGYRNRRFEGPFENRDEHALWGGTGLDIKFRRVDLGVNYLFAHINTPGEGEVLIRNEFDFGVDLNGDGDTIDPNIRTEQKVDRSRLEHTIGIKARVKITPKWSGRVGYDVRLQDFQSEEFFDITRVGRDDIRHRVGLGVQWKFAREWSLKLEGEWIQEKAERGGLPAVGEEEEKEYTKQGASLTLSYRF